ncbi:hypothetical protein COE47_32905 [Bacillus thuringiensis]|nr:hypothetical protein COE47_32905 [Bacillus thuringiensis]
MVVNMLIAWNPPYYAYKNPPRDAPIVVPAYIAVLDSAAIVPLAVVDNDCNRLIINGKIKPPKKNIKKKFI